jgi:hypothetical protein
MESVTQSDVMMTMMIDGERSGDVATSLERLVREDVANANKININNDDK